jgi:hypothetical protein
LTLRTHTPLLPDEQRMLPHPAICRLFMQVPGRLNLRPNRRKIADLPSGLRISYP